MQSKQAGEMGSPAAELVKHKAAIRKLAGSGEARALMGMLKEMGDVEQAAKAAAGGDAGSLKDMVERFMQTQQGAELVQRIEQQARQAGLE